MNEIPELGIVSSTSYQAADDSAVSESYHIAAGANNPMIFEHPESYHNHLIS